MSEAPAQIQPLRSSRLKLALFLAFALVVTLGFIASGFMLRDYVRGLGGNMLVTVRNESGERLRADVYVGPQFWPLELDNGKKGLLRFNPARPLPLEVSIFRRNTKLTTYEDGPYQPDTRYDVQVIIKSPEDVRFLHPEAAKP